MTLIFSLCSAICIIADASALIKAATGLVTDSLSMKILKIAPIRCSNYLLESKLRKKKNLQKIRAFLDSTI